MTEKRIKTQAIEIASAFYESNRTLEFRKTFPSLKDYLRGLWHRPNGDIVINKPGWMYHLDEARKALATQLRLASVSTYEKDQISDALIRDFNRATSPQAKKVLQRKEVQFH